MDTTELSPLDVLLMAMRALSKKAFNDDGSADESKVKLVADIAKAAAPYVHQRCGTGESSDAVLMRHEDRLKELE